MKHKKEGFVIVEKKTLKAVLNELFENKKQAQDMLEQTAEDVGQDKNNWMILKGELEWD